MRVAELLFDGSRATATAINTSHLRLREQHGSGCGGRVAALVGQTRNIMRWSFVCEADAHLLYETLMRSIIETFFLCSVRALPA